VWDQDWVVHCQPVGNGQKAFKHLAPYIFRVAISNSRLVSMDNNQVTFRYRPSGTAQTKLCTLEAEEFIRRFLQHVLPRGFVKVRYYGFLAPGCRSRLSLVREQLAPVEDEPEETATAQELPQPAIKGLPSEGEVLEAASVLSVTDANDESELDDAVALADEPEPEALANGVPLCPRCGCMMRRRGSLPPKGRSPP